MAQRGTDLWRRDPRPGVLVILAGIAGVAFAGLILAVMVSPAFVEFDEAASAAFRSWQTPALDTVLGAVTHVGGVWAMTVLTAIGMVGLIASGRRAQGILLAATVGLGTGAGWIAKVLVERARPGLEFARITLPDTYSFPSGHALASFLFFGVIGLLVLLEAKTLRVRVWTIATCTGAAVLIAASRVYLGVHWFGDITASWVLGVGIMFLASALYFMATSGADPRA